MSGLGASGVYWMSTSFSNDGEGCGPHRALISSYIMLFLENVVNTSVSYLLRCVCLCV